MWLSQTDFPLRSKPDEHQHIHISPTDLLNLPDWKSYDILNLIKPMMINIPTYYNF